MTQPTRPPAEFVPLASIVVPTGRHRQDFDPMKMTELANSIRTHGLFHALQVRADGVTLVSGETRLRVLRDPLRGIGKAYTYGGEPVPADHVPVIRVATEDPLALEEIELQENTARKDLTWQELAQTTARLERLRTGQAERKAMQEADVAKANAVMKAERPTPTTLAAEVRKSTAPAAVEATRQELIVAKHLADPEVAKAASLKDAMKVIKRKDSARQLLELGAMVGKSFTANDHKLEQGNCCEIMRNWAEDPSGPRFDVILTDPPYGMGAHEFGDGAGRLEGIEHHYDDSYETWKELLRSWAILSFAVAKPQAHAYVFCDFDRFHELKGFMVEAGWYVFRTPLINVKRNSGRVPLPDQGPRRQYEICLYAIKGKKPVNAIKSDVIITEADEQMSHGAQKPEELYKELLSRSIKPGDMVLDSFAGSGTIFPSCHAGKVIAYGIEQNPTYYGMCAKRLEALGAQKELPDV